MLGKLLLLFIFIQTSFALEQNQVPLIQFQINQLKSQLQELEKLQDPELSTQIDLLKKQITAKSDLLKQQVNKQEKEIIVKKEILPTKVIEIEKPQKKEIIKPKPQNKKNSIPKSLSLMVEKRALELAQRDGLKDGKEMALARGLKYAMLDGEHDGKQAAFQSAWDYSFSAGLKRGYNQGKIDSTLSMINVGKKEGHLNGLKEAAKRDAKKQALFDVEESNLETLARRQGKSLGRDKAYRDGHRVGKAKGQAHAIDKFENRNLTPVYVDGPFIGSFSPNSPGFIKDYCEINSCAAREKTLEKVIPQYVDQQLRGLFYDEYQFAYLQYLRQGYIQSIDYIYLNHYSTYFNAALEHHSKQPLDEAFREGKHEGKLLAEEDFGQFVKEAAIKEAHQIAFNNTDKEHPEYKKTYRRLYKEFKGQFWNEAFKRRSEQVQEETYRLLLETETIKAKSVRFAEVSDYYENYPVLSFEYTKLHDIGIDGIGAADGVFQPGEGLAHDIVIRNYGLEDAHNVLLVADGSLHYKIDLIPASSKLFLRGIAKSIVPSNFDGRDFTPQLEVFYQDQPLNSVLKHHFENADSSLLGSKVHSPIDIQYPLKMELLEWDEAFILGESKSIPFKITNISKAAMNGPLIITKDSSISEEMDEQRFQINLAPGETATLALNVEFKNEKEIYRQHYLESMIKFQQAVVGSTGKFPVLVKKPHNEKEIAQKDIIFIADGNRPQPILNQLMTNASGKFAILDTSISTTEKKKTSPSHLVKKSIILVHEKEQDLSRELLNQLSGQYKKSNLLVIKNSQTDPIALASQSKLTLSIDSLEVDQLNIVVHQNEGQILPVIIIASEFAKSGVFLSQLMIQKWNQVSTEKLSEDVLALKVLFTLLGDDESEIQSLGELVPALKSTLSQDQLRLDGEQLMSLYSKAKAEIQAQRERDLQNEQALNQNTHLSDQL